MTIVEHRDDTQRSLVQHATSGEYYIVQECILWDTGRDDTAGTRIIASAGPLHYADLGLSSWSDIAPSAPLFDAIDNAVNLSAEDAEWLNALADTGALNYPIGSRYHL